MNKELLSIEKTQKAKAASLEEKMKAEPVDDTLSADMSQISNKTT